MIKLDEIRIVESCWNKAEFNEPVFVLLGRDESAQIAVAAWVKDRIRRGKNEANDAQISEALAWIRAVEIFRKGPLAGVQPVGNITVVDEVAEISPAAYEGLSNFKSPPGSDVVKTEGAVEDAGKDA